MSYSWGKNLSYDKTTVVLLTLDNASLILQNASRKYVINLLDGAAIYDNKYQLTAPIGNLGYNIVITCDDITSTNPIFTFKYVEGVIS